MNENIAVNCPYCGEVLYIEPEPADREIEYIEDCHICCRPIVFSIHYSGSGSRVKVRREND